MPPADVGFFAFESMIGSVGTSRIVTLRDRLGQIVLGHGDGAGPKFRNSQPAKQLGFFD
jgi:hypothetical protein